MTGLPPVGPKAQTELVLNPAQMSKQLQDSAITISKLMKKIQLLENQVHKKDRSAPREKKVRDPIFSEGELRTFLERMWLSDSEQNKHTKVLRTASSRPNFRASPHRIPSSKTK